MAEDILSLVSHNLLTYSHHHLMRSGESGKIPLLKLPGKKSVHFMKTMIHRYIIHLPSIQYIQLIVSSAPGHLT